MPIKIDCPGCHSEQILTSTRDDCPNCGRGEVERLLIIREEQDTQYRLERKAGDLKAAGDIMAECLIDLIGRVLVNKNAGPSELMGIEAGYKAITRWRAVS